ncbi:MAG: hypothetical protein ACP5RD_08845, partial [bacterium]
LALEGEFLFLDKVLYFWRRHEKSLTINYNIEILRNYIKFIKYFWEKNENRIPENLKRSLKPYLGYHSKLELLKNLTLIGEFKEAKPLFEEIEKLDISNILEEHPVFKLKRTVTLLAYKLRSPYLLKFALSIKRKKYKKILGSYKPFFFKELDSLNV